MKNFTVKQVADLRRIIGYKIQFGSYEIARVPSTFYVTPSAVMVQMVEDQVRTHMLAGHTADDLIKSEDGK